MKQGIQRRVLPRERTGHSKHPLSSNTREHSTYGHHQMVDTKIRLIIFFADEDREALYSQQKQDQEQTVAQIMNFCCCCQVASVVSNFVQPQRQQPTRLHCPWDFPGKATRVGCHCLLQDHELLIAKFRHKLKKVEETTRPFRHDLNQILYDYTVKVRNRFKGLDLIDRVPKEPWTEVRDIVDHPKEKEMQKSKMAV